MTFYIMLAFGIIAVGIIFIDEILDGIDTFLAWISYSSKQTTESYCDIQTADSEFDLVTNDGSLLSIIEIQGYTALLGKEEFNNIHNKIKNSLSSVLSKPGFSIQVFFGYNKDNIKNLIYKNFSGTYETIEKLELDLEDLMNERIENLSRYCSEEKIYIALWTKPMSLSKEQQRRATKDKLQDIRTNKLPVFKYSQNLLAAIPDLRDSHSSFTRATSNTLTEVGIINDVLNVHQAIKACRDTIDINFTDDNWSPVLAGDPIKVKVSKNFSGDPSDLLWPSISRQLFPRDGSNIDMKTAKIGDKIWASVYIDLFPRQVQTFSQLFAKTLQTHIPWRISFLLDSSGLGSLKLKRALTSILSFTSEQNRLVNKAVNLLDYIDLNTDDSVIRLRVCASTWAPESDRRLLRTRSSQLARAIQSWGSCDVSEFCGDAFEGVASSMLGVYNNSVATPTVAPLSDTLYMLPLYRPASPWSSGAIMLRSMDGKPWPYQPGSSLQTVWIDLIYARPGSGKSVLSNAMNLGIVLSAGLTNLPRISIIDIGPSSSGLIRLLQDALPDDKRHLVQHQRLQMTPDYSINPFDTQLGCRFPTPLERSFLVNFICLLATPVGTEKTYEGVSEMAGLIIDEGYKKCNDSGNPNVYTQGMNDLIDAELMDIGFVVDAKTTWWEVTDALFLAGKVERASQAQKFAIPILSDLTSLARSPVVSDLYGKITISTGETLVDAFIRMISSAVREYPIIASPTKFDISTAKIVSLDLDEVAKTGGDAADRQTAVMYMLARYVAGKDFYLNIENLKNAPESYYAYHENRCQELREDKKRLVYDEFHRTSKANSVRDQVIVDMREGRKWNVQISLISQSLDDFDSNMVEFSTGVFILDAGPEQAIQNTTKVFGLSSSAQSALRNYVSGPKASGATMLCQFSTKAGINTQLLTLTLGPVELWAFSTTVEDATLRNKLYDRIGSSEARRILALLFPTGSAKRTIEQRLETIKSSEGFVDEEKQKNIIYELVDKITAAYQNNPKLTNIDF